MNWFIVGAIFIGGAVGILFAGIKVIGWAFEGQPIRIVRRK